MSMRLVCEIFIILQLIEWNQILSLRRGATEFVFAIWPTYMKVINVTLIRGLMYLWTIRDQRILP